MLTRTITKKLRHAVKTFAAVVITGPRQSGKTTLLRHEFGKTHQYINLENPDVQARAISDPIGFLENINYPVILDEIQYAPILLPYIKEKIDQNRHAGQWLLTGSQNFSLMKGVTESLAGRAAIITLLPLSLAERHGGGFDSLDIRTLITQHTLNPLTNDLTQSTNYIMTGGYPEPNCNSSIDYSIWASSYIKTYLERDVRDLKNIGSLLQFQTFLRSCAIRTGQILELSELARDIGISFTTAKTWLSILVASYQIILLPQYFQNLGKRLTKRPKLYFVDTGLASYLMGINSSTLLQSPQYGALFETMVVVDMFKRCYHHLEEPQLYFLHTRDGFEVDLLIETNQELYSLEIKSTSTITPKHMHTLIRLNRELPTKISGCLLITNAKTSFQMSSIPQQPAIPFLSL